MERLQQEQLVGLEEVPQLLAQLLSPLVLLPQQALPSRWFSDLHACADLLLALSQFCPEGSLYFFSAAGCGGAGSQLLVAVHSVRESSDGTSAVAGKLLAT